MWQSFKTFSLFPNARWVEVNNAKTFIQEDGPEETVAIIQQLCGEVFSKRDSNYL
jgi:predicted Zn-dependent protease